jgi:hypothetical protein
VWKRDNGESGYVFVYSLRSLSEQSEGSLGYLEKEKEQIKEKARKSCSRLEVVM